MRKIRVLFEAKSSDLLILQHVLLLCHLREHSASLPLVFYSIVYGLVLNRFGLRSSAHGFNRFEFRSGVPFCLALGVAVLCNDYVIGKDVARVLLHVARDGQLFVSD